MENMGQIYKDNFTLIKENFSGKRKDDVLEKRMVYKELSAIDTNHLERNKCLNIYREFYYTKSAIQRKLQTI